MAPNAEPKSSPKSPTPALSKMRIQYGKIDKSRMKKGEAKSPNYSISGRTFACEACKKGHRVSKCTHALQRPVHMTNDPGRPSADQKRHCDCPKICSCTKKNCKCDRNCSCTQVMYMLVYIPIEKEVEKGDTAQGEWRIGKEVITDLKGNELSEVEVKERMQLKSLQKNGNNVEPIAGASMGSPTSKTSPEPQSISIQQTGLDTTSAANSCCAHRKAIEESTPTIPKELLAPTTEEKRPRCNCGSGCSCAFCLDHPNNSTSQRIAKQQVAQFAGQALSPDLNGWQANMTTGSLSNMSCMGTNPQFAMYSNPNPSAAELHNLFGGNPSNPQGYYLSYPITGTSWTALQYDKLATFSPVNFSIPASDEHVTGFHAQAGLGPPTPHLHVDLATEQLPLQSPSELLSQPPIFQLGSQIDFSKWGIGDASVSSNYGHLDDWNSPDLQWTTPIHGGIWPPIQTVAVTPSEPPLQYALATNHNLNFHSILNPGNSLAADESQLGASLPHSFSADSDDHLDGTSRPLDQFSSGAIPSCCQSAGLSYD